MTTLTTERSGKPIYSLLVLFVAISVVAWGIGYRASLCSTGSLVRHSLPPARMLAHRACLERGVSGPVLQPSQQLTRVAIPAYPSFAPDDPLLRSLADGPLPAIVGVALHRLRLPRPPPSWRA